MDFLATLEAGHSKASTDKIVAEVLANPSRIEDLMACFFHENMRICQRASWAVSILGEKAPELIKSYTATLLENLEHPHHDAIVRNTLRAWQFIDFEEDYEGLIFDRCMDYLNDTKYAVAIRAFAMTVCSNIACKYPPLAEELIPIIELHYPDGSAGYKSRAKRELKRLRAL